MERLTTDTPQTNMEILANYAYAKDKEVRLIYGDGHEDVALADYIADHAKTDFDCSVSREAVLNGDSCWECDCPLAVLNAVATQAAELRSRLKKYEDSELSPDICAEYKKFEDEAIGKNVTFKRIVELMNAQAERRLIELPCPMFAQIYMIVTKRARSYSTKPFRFIKTTYLTWGNLESVLRSFGKTVFLDRYEAEAAMKKMNEEGS